MDTVCTIWFDHCLLSQFPDKSYALILNGVTIPIKATIRDSRGISLLDKFFTHEWNRIHGKEDTAEETDL